MEILYYILISALTGIVIWYVMDQKSKSLVLEAKRESEIILAGLEAKEASFTESLQSYEEKMKDSFKVLAQSAFDDAVARADEQKACTLNEATESLAKAMEKYSENINATEAKSLERGTRLEERINQVSALGTKLSEETTKLTRALKSDSQIQGTWGEVVLENLLQSLGFRKGVDYTTQTSFPQEDGTRPKTDFIINLPDNLSFIRAKLDNLVT